MNADTFSSDLVHLAYHLLKPNAYYDKMDLFLRANVTAYEVGDLFRERQAMLTTIVGELRKRDTESEVPASYQGMAVARLCHDYCRGAQGSPGDSPGGLQASNVV
jgi:hypothetical protein